MRFDERALKPHSEPVTAKEIEEGSHYFFVTFADEEMLFPAMEPFVFVGKDLEAGDIGQVYFQDADSYRRGVRYDTTTAERSATFYTGSKNELGGIFHFERGLDVFLACSLRRRRMLAQDRTGGPILLEAVEIEQSAEPVSASDLREGSVYFLVHYIDDEKLIPSVESLVYIGRDLDPGDAGQVHFQDIESFRGGVRYGIVLESDYARFTKRSEKEVSNIFEYEHALEELMRCSLRRRERGGEVASHPGRNT